MNYGMSKKMIIKNRGEKIMSENKLNKVIQLEEFSKFQVLTDETKTSFISGGEFTENYLTLLKLKNDITPKNKQVAAGLFKEVFTNFLTTHSKFSNPKKNAEYMMEYIKFADQSQNREISIRRAITANVI
jgi:hypothetical protein